jgi:hypothetical protein
MKNVLLGMCLILALNSNASTPGSTFPIKHVTVSVFEFLNGHTQGTGFVLQWKISNSLDVTSYQIESTYEDPFDIYSNWAEEGTISNPKKGAVKFVDTNVLPGVISYRVTANFANGRPAEVSEIFTTTIE